MSKIEPIHDKSGNEIGIKWAASNPTASTSLKDAQEQYVYIPRIEMASEIVQLRNHNEQLKEALRLIATDDLTLSEGRGISWIDGHALSRLRQNLAIDVLDNFEPA